MPTPVPIKTLLDPEQYASGQTVMCVTGKLIGLFPEKKGTGQSGEYSFQNGTIENNGARMKIVFSKCSQPMSAKGQTITISSTKTAQHGWQGVKVEDNDYTKQDGTEVHERQLKVTPSAEISYAGASGSGYTGGGGAKDSPQRPGQSQTTSTTHPSLLVADALALHIFVDEQVRAHYSCDPETYKEEVLQAYVASVFIESVKQGAAQDFRERFKKPVPKTYPPPPSDPSKWKECVIPSGSMEGKTLAEIPDIKLLELYAYYDSKGSETPLALNVYQATKDRGIMPKQEDEQPPEEDNLP